jgi:hypothetical protein
MFGTGSDLRPLVSFKIAALLKSDNLIWCADGRAYIVESVWTSENQALELYRIYKRHALFRAPHRVAGHTWRVDLFPKPQPSANKRVNGKPINGSMNSTEGAVLRTGNLVMVRPAVERQRVQRKNRPWWKPRQAEV